MKLCLFTAFFIWAFYLWVIASLAFKLEDLLSKNSSNIDWDPVVRGAIMVVIICLVFVPSNLLWRAIHKWRKTSMFTKCYVNIISGLIVIAAFSIIGIYQLSREESMDDFLLFFFINIFIATYAMFITGCEELCEWKQKSGKVYELFLRVLVSIHIFVFYKSISMHKNSRHFIVIQLAFSLICASSTCDILAILMGKLKLKKEEEVKLEEVKVEKRSTRPQKQPAAQVGYVQIKEKIPLSTRFANAVNAFFQKN